jgi:phage regulatory protein, rha family|nr:MAG TPA: antirepressor protein [Caudoviricetes sp.]
MNELLNVQIENNPNYGLVVSSRVVAQGLGKRHSDVLESLDKILENGDFRSLCIPNTYKVEGQQREYKEYLLTKDGFTLYMFNIQGYNDFKMAYINRFNEMEKAFESKQLPKTFAQALRAYADEVEKNEQLRLEVGQQNQVINELKPKATYYDLILSSVDCLTVTQIAKDYGMTAQALNQFLFEKKIQFKQSGTWLLYQNYADKGYTKSDTVAIEYKNGEKGSKLNTKWTQKGRLFLYQLLKNNNILPLIER